MKITHTNWNMTRQLVDQFWRRWWVSEYLLIIAKRINWFDETEDLRENDLVRIVNERWTRGRVAAVISGSDVRIRQATIQTNGRIFRCPVNKLGVLQVQGQSNAEAARRRSCGSFTGPGMLLTLITLLI